MQRSLAAALAVFAAYLVFDYPVFRPLLAGLLLFYALLMSRRPLIWLAVLPASVAVLEMAHWSGRLFIEDLDILFLLTLALLIWRPAETPRARNHLPLWVYALVFTLLASYATSLALGLTPWPDWAAPDFLASFISQANALRQVKGFFWALLLLPFILRALRQYPDQARQMVMAGMVAGGIGVGAMALWERGVFQALVYGHNIYQLLSPLIDFSTTYRVTGPFAEMHTGGEAIDGYLGLAWPMTATALVLSRRPWPLALGGLAAALVIYTLVVTFSRGLYFSLPVAGSVLMIGLIRSASVGGADSRGVRFGRMIFFLAAALLAMGYGYSRGGTLTLASAITMFVAAAWSAWWPMSRTARIALLAALLGINVWAAARGMYTSKWNAVSVGLALPPALAVTLAAASLGYLAGKCLPRDGGIKPFLVLAMILVVGAGTLVPALLGYRMTERLADAGTDLSTRTEHWRHALSLKAGRTTDQLFGMGLGSFPREYHWDNAHRPEGSGNFTLLREEGNTFLRTTGGKDLRLGQRIALPATTPVHLSLRVRSPSPKAWLKLRICRRFVIHPTEWNGQCASLDHRMSSTAGQWTTLGFDFDTSAIGDGRRLGQPPLLLEINNRREYDLMFAPPAIVDVDDIRLTDAAGRPLLENGDFEQGTDHWLPYYDFNHLPWHIKNLWLHLYFEQGALGVLAFAWSWLAALGMAWRAAARGNAFAVGLGAALTGFVAVGTFGSPIDAPRVAWLYYFLFFVLVAEYTATLRPKAVGAARRVHPPEPERQIGAETRIVSSPAAPVQWPPVGPQAPI